MFTRAINQLGASAPFRVLPPFKSAPQQPTQAVSFGSGIYSYGGFQDQHKVVVAQQGPVEQWVNQLLGNPSSSTVAQLQARAASTAYQPVTLSNPVKANFQDASRVFLA